MELCKFFNESEKMNIIINNLRFNIENESKIRTSGYYNKFLFSLKEKEYVYGGCYGVVVKNNLHVRLLWIDKKYRRKKFATSLIKETEKFAKGQGCSFITVNTIANKIADKFYKKLGYYIEYAKVDKTTGEVYENYYRKDL